MVARLNFPFAIKILSLKFNIINWLYRTPQNCGKHWSTGPQEWRKPKLPSRLPEADDGQLEENEHHNYRIHKRA